jgi:hypothetical protein
VKVIRCGFLIVGYGIHSIGIEERSFHRTHELRSNKFQGEGCRGRERDIHQDAGSVVRTESTVYVVSLQLIKADQQREPTLIVMRINRCEDNADGTKNGFGWYHAQEFLREIHGLNGHTQRGERAISASVARTVCRRGCEKTAWNAGSEEGAKPQ